VDWLIVALVTIVIGEPKFLSLKSHERTNGQEKEERNKSPSRLQTSCRRHRRGGDRRIGRRTSYRHHDRHRRSNGRRILRQGREANWNGRKSHSIQIERSLNAESTQEREARQQEIVQVEKVSEDPGASEEEVKVEKSVQDRKENARSQEGQKTREEVML
jgi:hypothetical protein